MGRTVVVGLTGGIGSGKSTVARMLEESGARIVDADRIAREVVAPGTEGLEAVRARFGGAVFDLDGRLDRAALGAIVFSDAKARADLEAITHPRIAAVAAQETARAIAEHVPVVVYEAALIVENRLYEGLDALIVVACAEQTQVRRVVERDGLSEDEARRRLSAQLPLAEKVKVADYVVDNDGTLDETRSQVDAIWRKLTHAED